MPTEAEKVIFAACAAGFAPKEDKPPQCIEPHSPSVSDSEPCDTWAADFADLVFIKETRSGDLRYWTPATDRRTTAGYIAGNHYGAAAARDYLAFVTRHGADVVASGGMLHRIVLAMLDYAAQRKLPPGEVVGFFGEIETHIAHAAAAKGGA